MRPPATTGCVPPELAPGSPNAQASFRCGTSRAVIAAASPDWKRALVIPAPQPFQLGPVSEARNGPAVLPQNAEAGMIAGSPPNDLPETYSPKPHPSAPLFPRPGKFAQEPAGSTLRGSAPAHCPRLHGGPHNRF